MESTFDYQRDIAPAFTRFFGEIQADSRLSPAAKERLQSGLFANATALDDQRRKIRADRQSSAMNSMRMEQSRLAMEDDAMRREQQQRQIEQTEILDSRFNEVVNSADNPLVKSRKLGELELEFSGLAASSPDVSRRFAIARTAMAPPKPAFTPAQMVEYASKMPEDVLRSGDPILMGQAMSASAEFDAMRKLATDEMKTQVKESNKVRMDMLTSDLEFTKPDHEAEDQTPRLTPAAHAFAEILVEDYGSQEEREFFESLIDDQERAELAERIRVRQLGVIARAAVEGPPSVSALDIVRGSR